MCVKDDLLTAKKIIGSINLQPFEKDDIVGMAMLRYTKLINQKKPIQIKSIIYYSIKDYFREKGGRNNKNSDLSFISVFDDFLGQEHVVYDLDVANKLSETDNRIDSKIDFDFICQKLSKKERDIVYFYYFLGYDCNEIGSFYNVSGSRINLILNDMYRRINGKGKRNQRNRERN